jgi:hypothetical protein
VVVRPVADEDWPKAEPLPRAFGGVLRGVAAKIGAMARSSSDCLLVTDAGRDLIGYAWPQDLGAQMRHAETMRLCEGVRYRRRHLPECVIFASGQAAG